MGEKLNFSCNSTFNCAYSNLRSQSLKIVRFPIFSGPGHVHIPSLIAQFVQALGQTIPYGIFTSLEIEFKSENFGPRSNEKLACVVERHLKSLPGFQVMQFLTLCVDHLDIARFR